MLVSSPAPAGPPESVGLITFRDAIQAMENRRAQFANTLALSIEVSDLEIRELQPGDPFVVVTLRVAFANLSASSLVFRKPYRVGFYTASGCVTDGVVHLYDTTGEPISILTLMADCFDTSLPDTPDAFVSIRSGGVYVDTYEVVLPYVIMNSDEAFSMVPPGQYQLSLEYSNIWVGHQMPFELQPTPPSSFNSGAELEDWFYSQKTCLTSTLGLAK